MALRQLRGQLIGTAALIGVVVVLLVVHGTMARHVAADLAVACGSGDGELCDALQTRLAGIRQDVLPYLGSLSLTPVLVAAIWGAPLISREIESGTAALAWCQSVTRRRWFTVRLAVSAAAMTLLGLALGVTVTWWLAAFTALDVDGESGLRQLTVHGPLLPALWVAALIIGVLVGILARRVVPASGVSAIVTFVAVIVYNASVTQVQVASETDPEVLTDLSVQALAVLLLAAVLVGASFRQLARVRV